MSLRRSMERWLVRHVMIGMRCQDIDPHLGDYLDGTLGTARRLHVRLHLVMCRACRQYLEGYLRGVEFVRGTARAQESHPPPASLVRRVVDAVERNQASPRAG